MAVVIEGKGQFIKLLAKWSCLCNLDPKNYLLFGTSYVFSSPCLQMLGNFPFHANGNASLDLLTGRNVMHSCRSRHL